MIFPMLRKKTTQRDLDLTRAAFYFPTTATVWVLKIDFALKSHTPNAVAFRFSCGFGAWDFGTLRVGN